jgi:hypothetical protein
MLFRRKSRTDRLMDAARLAGERVRPSRRTARTVGLATGGLALLTAASSGVSALRQKSS